MSKFYWILGVVAVLGLAIVGYQVGSGVVSQASTEPVDLGDLFDNPSELMALARPVIKGNPDAAWAHGSCVGNPDIWDGRPYPVGRSLVTHEWEPRVARCQAPGPL